MNTTDRKAIAAGAHPECDCDDCLAIYETVVRRERLGLPEPDAEHACRADGAEQACYAGQWTIHGPHDFEVERAAWRGGGKHHLHCPGKTPETVLGS